MATKDFTKGVVLPVMDGSDLRVGIIRARWNDAIVGALTEGCLKSLRESKVKEDNIEFLVVPGSFELPFAAKHMIKTKKLDAVICLGTLIKGETHHYEYICESVAHAIQNVGLETGVPVVFGVLMCPTEDQAKARAGLLPNGHNHGLDWGSTAVEMGLLRRSF